MRFHPYKQPYLVELPKGTTIRDLQALADFNRIIKNYMQMVKLLEEGKSEADKEAVKKISKYASKEIARQIKEKMKESGIH